MHTTGHLPGLGERVQLNPPGKTEAQKRLERYEKIMEGLGVMTPEMRERRKKEEHEAYLKEKAAFDQERRGLRTLIQ